MDGAPAVEEELDSVSLILPLPYRLALLIVLGVWLWGVNLHALRLLKIDVPHLIRYPARSSTNQPSHHLSIYRFASLLTLPLLASVLLFWTLTHGTSHSVIVWHIVPNLYLLLLLLAFLIPVQHLPRAGRLRFLHTLRRISIGGLAKTDDGKFGDVLLADALTSYAKPLSEVYVTLCMLVTGQHTTARPDRHCGGTYILSIVMCVPFLIRFRQCIIDRQPANALKYATAFPAIALSAMQRHAEDVGLTPTSLFRLWFFFAMINSLYSFYWDVARDWDLSLFSSDCNDPSHPFGLRRQRVFDSNTLYYAVIAVDLVLRCTWSAKLSVHLEHFYDIEGGIFLLEIMEIFRRWMWVFFRVEAEWLRARASGDVLLDDLGPKIDED
ncbi:EXS family-domain-containing protein [Neohortaea acidophila]|uniref:EXS family-domain-containing protein n=1 Tax=Neohortaea acidophila TaxID=245834 RepID=A0A6A6PN13_9PEZI|nr:EXS family-domain-containing protein [Neohortaea acidophila]KAF2481081.1 EXS family-domain-containing protein [Neohortaea acidophila]